jgi:hypothetical protein
VQLWTDPVRQTGNTVVIFLKSGAPKLKKDDLVRVDGQLDGEFVGKSDNGEVLHLPRVKATSVTLASATGGNPSPGAGAAASPSASASPNSAVAAATAVSTPRPAPTATRTPGPLANGTYRVSGSGGAGLNVRAGASASQPKAGVVHDGELVLVIASPAGSPGWVQIAGDGFSGYVSSSFLSGPIQAGSSSLAKLSAK